LHDRHIARWYPLSISNKGLNRRFFYDCIFGTKAILEAG
jgi:hypothetical protein